MTDEPGLFSGKAVLITGGTGSLGKTLVRRLLSGSLGRPRKVIVFSRDEAKQFAMRAHYRRLESPTEEITYRDYRDLLEFRIGDVRDFHSVSGALRLADVIVNAAALKQVPICEYSPFEAARTNVLGAENIVRAIEQHDLPIETVIGVSTDKACLPVNVMGMTKAIQERLFIQANLRCRQTRFVCVRYGNVLASRGSVIPLFHSQIQGGGPVTLTTRDMTRFLLSLEDAVDTVLAAYEQGRPGQTFIPIAPAARIENVARALIGDRGLELELLGIRPGEKVHEILVSSEEAHRTGQRAGHYVIQPMLPELHDETLELGALSSEYGSNRDLLDLEGTRALLERNQLLLEQVEGQPQEGELLR